MSALGIWQRLSEFKAGIAAIGARLSAPSKGEPSPAPWDEQTTGGRANIANSATVGAARPYAVRLRRPPSRYY
jgi:hypothetical protein